MDKKNRCVYCGSIRIKYVLFLFVQCEECGEVQGLIDLKTEFDTPLNQLCKKKSKGTAGRR